MCCGYALNFVHSKKIIEISFVENFEFTRRTAEVDRNFYKKNVLEEYGKKMV